MFWAIRNFTLYDLKNRYVYKWTLISDLLRMLLTLFVFYMMGKAFLPNQHKGYEFFDQSYFGYLIIGELALIFPALMFEGLVDRFRFFVQDGSFEFMATLERPKSLLVSSLAFIPLIREFLHFIVYVLLAVFFFGFSVTFSQMGYFLLVILSSVPAFLGLGLLAAAVLLRFGRGDGLIGYISSLGAIFGGAYFPLELMPNLMVLIFKFVSPYNNVLVASRICFLRFPDLNLLLEYLVHLLIQGGLLLLLGVFLFEYLFEQKRKEGAPFVVG